MHTHRTASQGACQPRPLRPLTEARLRSWLRGLEHEARLVREVTEPDPERVNALRAAGYPEVER